MCLQNSYVSVCEMGFQEGACWGDRYSLSTAVAIAKGGGTSCPIQKFPSHSLFAPPLIVCPSSLVVFVNQVCVKQYFPFKLIFIPLVLRNLIFSCVYEPFRFVLLCMWDSNIHPCL